jgi:hypothetical protein
LVFVDQNVSEFDPLWRVWIVADVLKKNRNNFTDEHCPMKAQPRQQRLFESDVLGVSCETWLLMLFPRPGGLVGLDASADRLQASQLRGKIRF